MRGINTTCVGAGSSSTDAAAAKSPDSSFPVPEVGFMPSLVDREQYVVNTITLLNKMAEP